MKRILGTFFGFLILCKFLFGEDPIGILNRFGTWYMRPFRGDTKSRRATESQGV